MSEKTDLSGVLLIDKPAGPTSFDVVRRVRYLLRIKRVGHTGTLDPAATGLLPICLGDATRIASYITDGTKEYEGLVRFGIRTDTLDAEGNVVETRDASALTRESVEHALSELTGVVKQAAPMYSARKVAGQRLYDLARRGEEVERDAREVTIDELKLLDWSPPDARIFVRCSKGTYIRVIAESLGESLEVGAHLAALRRVASGSFRVDEAITLDRLEKLVKEGGREAVEPLLLSVEAALEPLPAIHLDARTAISVAFGNALESADLVRLNAPPQPRGRKVRLVDPDGLVVAVGEGDGEGRVKLVRVLRARVGPGLHKR